MIADEAEQDRAFFDALRGEDDLGVVIRGAIHIESKLIELIEANLASPTELDRLEYADRVNVAIALGLDGSLKPALKAIGNVRNKFAHRIRSPLTDIDADNLYNALSPAMKAWCNEVYETLTASPKYGAARRSLNQQDAKYRWGVYLVAVHCLLKAAIGQSTRCPPS